MSLWLKIRKRKKFTVNYFLVSRIAFENKTLELTKRFIKSNQCHKLPQICIASA